MNRMIFASLSAALLAFTMATAAEAANDMDIANAMAKDAGISKAQAERALNLLTKFIAEQLEKGGKVTANKFGAFSVKEHKARKGKNPQTGATIDIPASKVVTFNAARELDNAIN